MSKREHDHEEYEDDIESSESSSSGDEGSNKAVDMAKGAGKTAGKKLGKMAMKKLGKFAVKLMAKIMAKLLALLGPYVLAGIAILIALMILFSLAYDIGYETKGKDEEYQEEDTRFDNPLKLDDKGEYITTSMSSANKIVKAYYAYYTQQSYFKVINKKMYNSKDLIVKDVKDKYSREKEFMLNPEFLWSLDENLHENKFRYPEQFIKPVHHDEETYELKQLTNENTLLNVESQKYDKKTGLAMKGEKELGVWDYGFAPILQYKEFKEEKEKRGAITEMQVWNKDKQKFENQSVENGKSKTEGVPGFPKTVYMIEAVTSSVGTIENKIEHEWQNTGEKWTKTITEDVTVDVRYEEEVEVPSVNEGGLPMYYVVDENGKKTSQITTGVTAYPVMTKTTVTKYKKETKPATRKIEGYVWSKEPRYEGEPDTSKIVGSRYIEDYMYHYETRVPKNVLGKLELRERTGKNIEGLEAILEDVEEELDEKSEYDNAGEQTTSGTSLDSMMGVQGGSAAFKNASQYLAIFQKYGETYGIDPMLLMAVSAQEAGGQHDQHIGDRCNYAGCGIMQIEHPGGVTTSASAFNYKTGQKETVSVSYNSVKDVDSNIRVGAMILQSRLQKYGNNILFALQAYNFGTGGIGAVAKVAGKDVDYFAKNHGDTSWMAARQEVHTNPSKYFSWSSGTYGDPTYAEKIMKHYPGGSGQKPWAIDKAGNKVYVDGNIKMGEGIAQGDSSSGGFSILNLIDLIVEKWAELFPDAPKEFSPQHVKFANKQIGDAPIDILNMAFAMKEKKYFSEYTYITPKQWKEKYKLLFSAPPSMTGGTQTSIGQKLSQYFPNGYGNVVEKADKVAVPYNGVGISIQAPEGSKVLAIADGKVKEVGRDFVVIDHGEGAVSRYSTLKQVKVKEGDDVKKGATIGISGKNVFLEVQLDGQPTDPSWIVAGGSLTGAFITPAQGRFTSAFGWRPDPFGGSTSDYHTGIDIAAPIGTPILAAADGVVIDVGYRGGYGNLIHVKHTINGKTMSTVYAHLQSMNVNDGDEVKQGQIIGGMGSTGNSTGSHLHFEIQDGVGRYKDNPLDPAKFIKL
ncbi:DNA-dirted RNA polymerase (plasmid) [Jeotgalibacillus malaysiensis]|uniref:DNA-dirted RNA polymerase n=1 Tax=Jeotgalibacillus malaysiensis TaxID=1508404 RepID=A0A0B5AYH1_9BACL|nr:peptidoglycan DD-metalloendopeptidase family protein [Jeotgalibacillus malaysiensis]AJD93558.1 DNA-dirted RNA polymerase [Jeotgalibacillus malaysiensis]